MLAIIEIVLKLDSGLFKYLLVSVDKNLCRLPQGLWCSESGQWNSAFKVNKRNCAYSCYAL